MTLFKLSILRSNTSSYDPVVDVVMCTNNISISYIFTLVSTVLIDLFKETYCFSELSDDGEVQRSLFRQSVKGSDTVSDTTSGVIGRGQKDVIVLKVNPWTVRSISKTNKKDSELNFDRNRYTGPKQVVP